VNRPLRVVVGAAGLAGHTLPALALAGRLRERGHTVRFHGYRRWRDDAASLDLEFAGSESELVELTDNAGGHAAVSRALAGEIEAFGADVVVGDGLTLTPGLAAELAGVPCATLLPEVFPVSEPGLPPFSLGLFAPRTRAGSALWRRSSPALSSRLPTTAWLAWARDELNRLRAELGLPPARGLDAPGDRALTLVATLPELEYPREWPPGVHVTGPLFFEPPRPGAGLPAGDGTLVVVAPSTVKDPEARLARAAMAALADEPVRVAVTTGGGSTAQLDPPANVTVAEWIDFGPALREATLVICHGNHGTVARALTEGAPLLISPALPDDAEHGARVAWAGAGLMLPARLLGPATLRRAARAVLSDPRYARRAGEIAAAQRGRDGADAAATLVEGLARGSS
jgi:UDP:flavonoid glycosyltransferase YjiC (YdhE family)